MYSMMYRPDVQHNSLMSTQRKTQGCAFQAQQHTQTPAHNASPLTHPESRSDQPLSVYFPICTPPSSFAPGKNCQIQPLLQPFELSSCTLSCSSPCQNHLQGFVSVKAIPCPPLAKIHCSPVPAEHPAGKCPAPSCFHYPEPLLRGLSSATAHLYQRSASPFPSSLKISFGKYPYYKKREMLCCLALPFPTPALFRTLLAFFFTFPCLHFPTECEALGMTSNPGLPGMAHGPEPPQYVTVPTPGHTTASHEHLIYK